jgi:hypothetical protein
MSKMSGVLLLYSSFLYDSLSKDIGITLQVERISHRGIAASTGNSRQKVTEVIVLAV